MQTQQISMLKNLGPKSAVWLADIGITTQAQLLAQDPFEVFKVLKEKHGNISLNMLYALIGACEDKPWQDIKRLHKTEIVLRLEEMGLL